MKTTKKEFLADVQHEVEMLKRNATKTELSRLNFNHFDADSKKNCIYGQMTGSCESNRAHKLMDKACVKVVSRGGQIDGRTFSQADLSMDNYGTQVWDNYGSRGYRYLSSLETYIFLKGAKIQNIIDYLKDTTNKASLKL